jgi:hypothetical protein
LVSQVHNMIKTVIWQDFNPPFWYFVSRRIAGAGVDCTQVFPVDVQTDFSQKKAACTLSAAWVLSWASLKMHQPDTMVLWNNKSTAAAIRIYRMTWKHCRNFLDKKRKIADFAGMIAFPCWRWRNFAFGKQ